MTVSIADCFSLSKMPMQGLLSRLQMWQVSVSLSAGGEGSFRSRHIPGGEGGPYPFAALPDGNIFPDRRRTASHGPPLGRANAYACPPLAGRLGGEAPGWAEAGCNPVSSSRLLRTFRCGRCRPRRPPSWCRRCWNFSILFWCASGWYGYTGHTAWSDAVRCR